MVSKFQSKNMIGYVFALDRGAEKRKGYANWRGEVWCGFLTFLFQHSLFDLKAFPAGPGA